MVVCGALFCILLEWCIASAALRSVSSEWLPEHSHVTKEERQSCVQRSCGLAIGDCGMYVYVGGL